MEIAEALAAQSSGGSPVGNLKILRMIRCAQTLLITMKGF